VITVLDGWRKSELDGVMKPLNNFDLLATSLQFVPKADENVNLILLPAWSAKDLASLWEICPKLEPSKGIKEFVDKYYYSGGSARVLLDSLEDIFSLFDPVIKNLSLDQVASILSGNGGSVGVGLDTLMRRYIVNGKSVYVIDSAYVLNKLNTILPLAEYVSWLNIARADGGSHYGLCLETLVNKLFRIPNKAVTFHAKRWSSNSSSAEQYVEYTSEGVNTAVECKGTSELEALKHLKSRIIDLNKDTYWYPDFARFPNIDSVLILPKIKTVLYLQTTVGQTHTFSAVKMLGVHKLVNASLIRSIGYSADGWTFNYIAFAQFQEDAEALQLKNRTKNADGNYSVTNLLDDDVVSLKDSVSMWKGYLSY
jgi:hypothetical protein